MSLCQLADNLPCQRAFMHFVGSIGQVECASVRPHGGQREIIAHASAAENLDGAVDDIGHHFRCDNFNHGDLFLCGFFAQRIDHPRRFEGQEARLLDLQFGLSDPILDDALFGQGFAKGNARVGALAHQLQGVSRRADRAHAVMDASRSQAGLGDGEAAARLSQQVANGDAHILKQHLTVALVIDIAHDGQVA